MSDDRKNNPDDMNFDDIDDFLSMDNDDTDGTDESSENFGDIFDDDRPDTDPEDDIVSLTGKPDPNTDDTSRGSDDSHDHRSQESLSHDDHDSDITDAVDDTASTDLSESAEDSDTSFDHIFDDSDADKSVDHDDTSRDNIFDDTADDDDNDLSASFSLDEDVPEPDYMTSARLDDDTADDVDPDLAALFDVPDHGDDSTPDDSNDSREKKEKKKKIRKKDKKKGASDDPDQPRKNVGKKIGVGVGIVAVIAVIGGCGYYFTNNKSATTDEKPQPAELQLVNQEQVEWAGSVCKIMDNVSQNAKIPDVFKGTNIDPLKARNQLSKVFVANSKVMTTAANSLKNLPKDNLDRVKDIQFSPSVMTNWKKVGDAPDKSIIKASNSLMNTLDNYSHNLTSYSTRLDGVATYNATGLIDAVTSAREDFINASQSMETNLKNTLSSTQIFDNAATMKAVSELPFCGNRFISESDLVKIDKDVKEQKVIYNHVTYKRCKAFIDTARQVGREDDLAMIDTESTGSSASSKTTTSEPAKDKKVSKDVKKAVKKDKKGKKMTEAELRDKRVSDTFRSDIRACNEFLKVAVPDTESPVLAHGVVTHDDLRAEPKLPGYAEEIVSSGAGTQDPTASRPSSAQSSTPSTTKNTPSTSTKQKKINK